MSGQKRVLAVHDISCFGRCSLTVALPIISAAGMETTVLPTAVLSTHTGGFTGFTYRDLTDDIVPILDHWKTLDITFDAAYTGFLGSFEQIGIVSGMFDHLRSKGTRIFVDPVMADNGELYKIFPDTFPEGMRGLCAKADVIIPNITEATLMLGESYVEGPYTEKYIEGLLQRLSGIGADTVVLTGVYFEGERLGAASYEKSTGHVSYAFADRIPGYYHGTGDVFGSALVGAMMRGVPVGKAIRVAVDFTAGSIRRTYDAKTDIRFGVNFEEGIGRYIEAIDMPERQTAICKASRQYAGRLAGIGSVVWYETYEKMLPPGQVEYMLNKYQSPEAIARQIAVEGYIYYIMTVEGFDAGYMCIRPERDAMLISKIYVLGEFRRMGLARLGIETAVEEARSRGLRKLYLRVNVCNEGAVSAYERLGFRTVRDDRADIGNGFVMDDHIMEMDVPPADRRKT